MPINRQEKRIIKNFLYKLQKCEYSNSCIFSYIFRNYIYIQEYHESQSHKKILELLVKYINYDINSYCQYKITPLSLIIYEGNCDRWSGNTNIKLLYENIDFLITLGANPYVKDIHGLTSYDYAKISDEIYDQNIISILDRHVYYINTKPSITHILEDIII